MDTPSMRLYVFFFFFATAPTTKTTRYDVTEDLLARHFSPLDICSVFDAPVSFCAAGGGEQGKVRYRLP